MKTCWLEEIGQLLIFSADVEGAHFNQNLYRNNPFFKFWLNPSNNCNHGSVGRQCINMEFKGMKQAD